MIHIDNAFLLKNPNLFDHKKCVFVIGAGISVASGIPDFRSPDGIFATLRKELKINGKELFTYDFGLKQESRKIYLKYISSLKRLCDKALPNSTHEFLSKFPKSRIYTQNIDGLEEKAGISFSKNDNTKGIYLHGNLALISCQYCGFKKSFEEHEISSFERGEEVNCPKCEERREHCIKNGIRRKPMGVMHPAIIHYQQIHPEGAFIGKMVEKDLDCDLLIVIGTSLYVDGVKKLVKAFCRGQNVKGKRVLVNLTKPNKEWEDFFDYFYEGDCNEFIKEVEILKKKYSETQINLNPAILMSRKHRTTSNTIISLDTTVKIQDVNMEKQTASTSINVLSLENPVKPILSNITLRKHRVSNTNTFDSKQYKNTIQSSISTASLLTDDLNRNCIVSSSKEKNAITEIDAQVRRLSIDSKQQSFENKLKILTKSLSDEEAIDMNVLEEVIKSSTQTEIDQSFCSSLQSEIESIVKEACTKSNEE